MKVSTFCSRRSKASCSTLDRLSQKTSRFSPSCSSRMILAALEREPTKSIWTSGRLLSLGGGWTTSLGRSDPQDSHSSISAGLPDRCRQPDPLDVPSR